MKESVAMWVFVLAPTLVPIYLAAPSERSAAEAQTSASSDPSLECVTVTDKYKGSVDLSCEDGATAVFGTCHTPGPIIIGDPSHNQQSYSLATEEAGVMDAAGLHCESSLPKVVAQLHCCRAN